MADTDLKTMMEGLDRVPPTPTEISESPGDPGGMTVDEQEDKVLRELEGPEEMDPVSPMEGPEGNDDSFFEEAEEETPSPMEEAKSNEVDAAEFDKGFAALLRDGWSTDALKELPKGTVVELGLKRAKVQSDVDEAYADLRALKSLQTSQNANGEQDNAEPGQTLSNEVSERLTEQFGEEAAQALNDLVKPLQDQLAAAQTALGQMGEKTINGELDRVRAEMSSRIPELVDDAEWIGFREEARQLADSSRYKDKPLDAVFQDLARIRFGDLPSERSEKTVRNKTRSNGQLSPPKKVAKEAPMSADEREDRILAALEGGSSPSEVRARFS